MCHVGKTHWRQEDSRRKQNVSKSKQGFSPEVWHAGTEGSWWQEPATLLRWQLFMTTGNKTGKSFFEAKVGVVSFQMLCSWHQPWGIPVESNIPLVGQALVTLVTSLLWHGAHFCWWAWATSPAQLFLSSLDAVITKMRISE